MQDLELREQVAIACGWTDLEIGDVRAGASLYGIHPNLTTHYPVTQYELSIDAIAAEFEKKGWDWDLERYTKVLGGVEYIAVSTDLIDYSNSESTGAIALCKLFLEINRQENK